MNNEYLPAYISGVTSSELNFTSHYGGVSAYILLIVTCKSCDGHVMSHASLVMVM